MERPEPAVYHKFIGGKGLAGYYLRDHITRDWHDPAMPRSSISLFRRVEKALETIALGSTPLETIHAAADFIAENFAEAFRRLARSLRPDPGPR